MKKSQKTRIVLIFMMVVCIIFCVLTGLLIQAGINTNSRIEKVSQSTEALQKELDLVKNQEKEKKIQIEELQKKASVLSDEEESN